MNAATITSEVYGDDLLCQIRVDLARLDVLEAKTDAMLETLRKTRPVRVYEFAGVNDDGMACYTEKAVEAEFLAESSRYA
jgi:hypothetical protein